MSDIHHADLDDPETWPLIGWAADIRPFLDKVNEDIRALAAYTIPQRVIVGLDPANRHDLDLEAMEIFFGGGLIPLCDRLIPSEGTE